LKIAVNTRLLLKDKLEGIGWFSFETLKRITRDHPEHQFYFIFDRKHHSDFIFSSNITPIEIGPQARHPVLYYIWFELSIPRVLKKIKPDLFLSPDGYIPLSTNIRTLVVFHDLNFEHYPGDLPIMERFYYKKFFPRFAQKASRIATVSEYSKSDIVKLYHVPPEKIDVVYNGANDSFHPVDEDIKTKTRDQYTNGSPYFIFVGSLHPRKNLANLFKAYDIFRKSYMCDVKLLIVGAKKWWTKEIDKTFNQLQYKDDVIFSGRLDTEQLRNTIASALAMTYVSYFEGFGIPITEAFYCGIPVITSNVTSMPEVAGDAALIVDPFSSESIADAMVKIATDENLRKSLVSKARERKDIFTWQKSADRLWNAIEKTVGS